MAGTHTHTGTWPGPGQEHPARAVTVREARREDMPAVHRMIHELAAYEGVPDGPTLSIQDLIEDGFESSPPWFFVLIAELEGEGEGEAEGEARRPAGYALCSRAYSSWTRRALYVEDLFVRPDARRRGVASHLLQALCQMALTAGVHRVDWHVLENNAPAQAFYRRIGARDLRDTEGRCALRLDRAHIEGLARDHRYSSL